MDIAKIFNSKTRQELFRLYFTNPESAYYLRELERLLGIPVSMIRKELMRLQEDGIFLSQRKGNLTLYSLNQSYQLFDELKSIVFKTIGIQGLLQDILKETKGVEVAFIYGSFAKNEAKAASDVDLFIIGKVDEDQLIREMNRLERVLKREINYSLYTPKDFQRKRRQRDSFIMDLLENKKIFLIGEENDLRKFYTGIS